MGKFREAEIQGRMSMIGGWERVGDMLVRSWQFSTARHALEFVNQIATVADRLDHHPDIVLSYRTVRVELNSRDDGGLTDRDFEMATALNALPADR